jgi:hypothetical protein
LRRSDCHRGCTEGSILIEVLVAIVLLTIILVPLATRMQAAREQAAAFRAEHGSLAASTGIERARAAWSWGPHVETAVWSPGLQLSLTVEADLLAETSVGLWADGWFIGEFTPDSDGSVVTKVGLLEAGTGQELIARVRVGSGNWGPPWRSFVPDALGMSGGPFATARFGSGSDDTEGGVVLHPACPGNPLLEVSDSSKSAWCDVSGLQLFLAPCEAGVFGLRLNGVEQSFEGEEERALDIYF